VQLIPSFFIVQLALAPLPLPFVDALETIEVETSTDEASVVRLRFALSRNAIGDWDLQTFDLFRPLVPVTVRVSFGSFVPQVLVNGYIRETKLQNSNQPGSSTLDVVAFDATATLMNHIEQPFPYPNQPDSVIAAQIFARYAMTPFVFPTPPTRTVLDVMTNQRVVDIRFLRELARRNGFELYVQPDPLAGTDVGHFHPPQVGFPPQGVLSVDFGIATNTEDFHVSYDTLRPTSALTAAVDPRTKVPVPAVAPVATEPPMGLEPTLTRILPPPIMRPTACDSANPAELMNQARSLATRTSRSIKGTGTVDALKYGKILLPGLPVAIRGAGRQHSGNYYVTKVTHDIARGHYRQRFEAWRNAVGLTGAELFVDPMAAVG
jgi:hypothetical protein